MSTPVPDSAAFRSAVRRIWQELVPASGAYANVEGGSIEQQRDLRLRLHHVANYAAALVVLGDGVRPLRLLELGCGSGVLSRAFVRAMPSPWRLTASDYSAELVARGDGLVSDGRIRFRQLDLFDLAPDAVRTFDTVMMLEVLEHLDHADAARLLARLHSGLRDGSRVIFSTLDRSPFPRPHSGYGPHRVEYDHREMNGRLADPEFNPFGQWRVLRLVSPRLAAAAVRSENLGGHLSNRVRAGLERSAPGRLLLHAILALGFRLYSRLPESDLDLAAWLEDIGLVEDQDGEYDQDSFGLVGVLEKR